MKELLEQYPTKTKQQRHQEFARQFFDALLPIAEETIETKEYFAVNADDVKDDWTFALLMNMFAEHFAHSENISVSYIRKGGNDGEKVEISFRVINNVIRSQRKEEK